jgi:hypothetical protein
MGKNNKECARNIFKCPELDEVLLVEKAIRDGDYPTEVQLYQKLGKKVTKKKIRTIVDYLETKGKVFMCKDGAIVWTWGPKMVAGYMKKKHLLWKPNKND